MPKVLDQQLVTRYGKNHALRNLIDEWIDTQRGILLAALKAGATCPVRGPFLLVAGEAKDRPNWKEEFSDYLFEKYEAEFKDATQARIAANAVLEGITNQARPKVPRLYSKLNANYGRKFPIRMPA